MTRVSYKEIPEKISKGCLINFTEYSTDMVGHHSKQVIVENAPVVEVVPAGQELGRDTIETYMNGPVTDELARVLFQTSYHRIVIQVGDERRIEFKILGLVEAYMLMDLQQLWVAPAPDQMAFPFIANPAEQVEAPFKTFSDYQVGAGLYRNLKKNSS